MLHHIVGGGLGVGGRGQGHSEERHLCAFRAGVIEIEKNAMAATFWLRMGKMVIFVEIRAAMASHAAKIAMRSFSYTT
jgi:hypothetical protein